MLISAPPLASYAYPGQIATPLTVEKFHL